MIEIQAFVTEYRPYAPYIFGGLVVVWMLLGAWVMRSK